jgi:hypothetical protein
MYVCIYTLFSIKLYISVQSGLNEADKLKSISILIYHNTMQDINIHINGLMLMLIKKEDGTNINKSCG